MHKPFTDGQIQALPARPARYTVALGAGLVLRVEPSGTKSWGMRRFVAGRAEAITLGPWPDVRIREARRRAGEIVSRARSQRCSLREAARGPGATVREFAERYLAEIVSKRRKDLQPVRRYLEREIFPSLGPMAIGEVNDADVQQLVFRKRDAGKPAAAAAVRDLLDRIFKYARVCRLRSDNPVEATPAAFVYQPRSRERALHGGELRLFYRKLGDAKLGRVYALALELLLLTLTRKSELRLARVSDVDLEEGVWEVPAEHSKTGKPHVVYLAPRAREIFRMLMGMRLERENPYVLPGKGSTTQPMAENALNRAVGRVKWGIAKFTPHDLRRTAATLLNEMDYDDDWIEAALNHARGGIRGVYNKAKYGAQRRKMLEEWAAWLEKRRAGVEE